MFFSKIEVLITFLILMIIRWIKKHEIDESILIMLRNKGRDLIDSKYNWDSVAENYKKLINRLIDE